VAPVSCSEAAQGIAAPPVRREQRQGPEMLVN
jgi:hypothetical protein